MLKKSWWNKKYGKDKICGITHTRLRPGRDRFGRTYVVYLNCKHGFYRTPLMEWAINSPNNPTCPLCRKEFDPVITII